MPTGRCLWSRVSPPTTCSTAKGWLTAQTARHLDADQQAAEADVEGPGELEFHQPEGVHPAATRQHRQLSGGVLQRHSGGDRGFWRPAAVDADTRHTALLRVQHWQSGVQVRAHGGVLLPDIGPLVHRHHSGYWAVDVHNLQPATRFCQDSSQQPRRECAGLGARDTGSRRRCPDRSDSNHGDRETAQAANEVKVSYVGQPQFQPIKGTTMLYAVNTPNKVIQVGDQYYLCYQGVWFVSFSPQGPWQLAQTVPQVIYTIPPSSPVYNVTYVTQVPASDGEVTASYTAGYMGAFVMGATVGAIVACGTGYYYPPYVYGGFYYPYAATYGYHTYNPYTGAYGYGGAAYGPYGSAHWGAAYNPNTGTYARGAQFPPPTAPVAAGQAYNPYTGAYGATRQGSNAYGSWGQSVVSKNGNTAYTQHATQRVRFGRNGADVRGRQRCGDQYRVWQYRGGQDLQRRHVCRPRWQRVQEHRLRLAEIQQRQLEQRAKANHNLGAELRPAASHEHESKLRVGPAESPEQSQLLLPTSRKRRATTSSTHRDRAGTSRAVDRTRREPGSAGPSRGAQQSQRFSQYQHSVVAVAAVTAGVVLAEAAVDTAGRR